MKIFRNKLRFETTPSQAGRRTEEILLLYELQLKSIAANFNLYEEGGREKSAKALRELFFGLTRTLSPDLFIEAGAMKAESSLRVKKLCPDARIMAFEANPYNFEKYSKEFDYSAQGIEYIHYALSNSPGLLTFNIIKSIDGNIQNKNTGRNSILERAQDNIDYERVKVPSTTLDIIFNSIINNNTIMGSNVLTGLVSNPKFPIGVDAEEFIKRTVLEKLNTL